jgi:hypothetical protein
LAPEPPHHRRHHRHRHNHHQQQQQQQPRNHCPYACGLHFQAMVLPLSVITDIGSADGGSCGYSGGGGSGGGKRSKHRHSRKRSALRAGGGSEGRLIVGGMPGLHWHRDSVAEGGRFDSLLAQHRLPVGAVTAHHRYRLGFVHRQ